MKFSGCVEYLYCMIFVCIGQILFTQRIFKKGYFWRFCVVNDAGESIFEYKYLCEYKAKIENIRCT